MLYFLFLIAQWDKFFKNESYCWVSEASEVHILMWVVPEVQWNSTTFYKGTKVLDVKGVKSKANQYVRPCTIQSAVCKERTCIKKLSLCALPWRT